VGAPESNAGDDFHFWWAASRALKLVEPGTILRRVTLEGLAHVDDPDDEYETVDVAEYLGGDDAASADALVLSQLKYSSRHPDTEWTTARLCKRSVRYRANGTTTPARSVIADLAAAYRRLVDEHGVDVASRARIALVSNQSAARELVSSVAAAAAWVADQGQAVQTRALLAALPAEQAATVQSLSEAVGARLSSQQFCAFMGALDLSQTGAMDRAALARAVQSGAAELTPGKGHDSALKLFHLVRAQALPDSNRKGVAASDVLAELGAPELLDLYPAPARFTEVADPLAAPGARSIAEAVMRHPGRLVVAHGDAGAGKTTAIRQMNDHLPVGSQVVHFDCYGGGDYLSAGEERHTPERFVTQVVNELAQLCGTPLLIPVSQRQEDLWRRLRRTLDGAVAGLPRNAVVVLAVDAADNAATAARECGNRSFLSELVRLALPQRVAVVLTARSHRVGSLGATTAAEEVLLAAFDVPTSAAHLRRHRADASEEDAHAFHDRTQGNPRAQFYVLQQAAEHAWDMSTLLAKSERTPKAVFDDLIDSALHVGGADAGGLRWLALMLALSRPVPLQTLATALDVDLPAVRNFAAGLTPGVQVVDDSIQFRDEDFETHVRDCVDPSEVIAAHSRLADLCLAARATDVDAAAHVADHLAASGRLEELLQLVLEEATPVGIADGFRREEVQGRRLDLAVRAAAQTADAAAAVRLAVRGCDTASRFDTLSRLTESHLELVARYTDPDLLRAHVLRTPSGSWLAPVFLQTAAVLSRTPERHDGARADLESAGGWLRRWMAQRNGEGKHWDVTPGDVAAAAEACYRLDGVRAALRELRRWRPGDLVLEAAVALAERLADDVDPAVVRRLLKRYRVPAEAQARVFAAVVSPSDEPDAEWVDEVLAALLLDLPAEPVPVQSRVLDEALRHGDRQLTADLAKRWSTALPSGISNYAGSMEPGTVLLRCHAADAVLSGNDMDVAALVPATLQSRTDEAGRTTDPRARERDEWLQLVKAIAAAAVLAARASLGQAEADEVLTFCDRGIAARMERATHRWFTYDRSYPAWASLVASAALDTQVAQEAVARLAGAAEAIRRDGAPELWMELAALLLPHPHLKGMAADLCTRAADYINSNDYPARERLDLLARLAELGAKVDVDLGRHLFDQAVEAATGVNDDAARLLEVHVDLAHRADNSGLDPADTAARLVRAAELMAPHVSEAAEIPYAEIAGAAARLDPFTGLAAASRWDDQDRIGLSSTLPAALTGAVHNGEIPSQQLLFLDHLIADDGGRWLLQLNVAKRLAASGATERQECRRVLLRAAEWVRRRVPARDQPARARHLVDAAEQMGHGSSIRQALEAVIRLGDVREGSVIGQASSRDWGGSKPHAPEVQALLSGATSRSWVSMAEDVRTLTDARVYGEELRGFITAVLQYTPYGQRLDALTTVASLPNLDTNDALAVLSDHVRRWSSTPAVATWAAARLPDLVSRLFTEVLWGHDTQSTIEQLRVFGDDLAIRHAALAALPEAREGLRAYGWRSVAALLGHLCPTVDAGSALLGLLDDRVPPDTVAAERKSAATAVSLLLWSAFGHPQRELRWRAAHSTRELLGASSAADAESLVEDLMRRLDDNEPGTFRDASLQFYSFSAIAALLAALERVAVERPNILAAHFREFMRVATDRVFPHAQIRELARRIGLAVAAAGDADPMQVEMLRLANQPSSWFVDYGRSYARRDRTSRNGRYDFDSMDTIPYWYGPLAEVFDVEVDAIAETAEEFIIDRWGLSTDDWWTDVRELRDERSYERTGHRHGSIPREESLRLYIEYHAMMATAGHLADEGRPVRAGTLAHEQDDSWEDWLLPHLPAPTGWLADLGTPVPADPEFLLPRARSATWDTASLADFDRALGLTIDDGVGGVSDMIRVAASVRLQDSGTLETVSVASALVDPRHSADLQRALASASSPTDWKLPDEEEEEFEVDEGAFRLSGWILRPYEPTEYLDRHDVYAYELRREPPLPGKAFRIQSRTAVDAAHLTLMAHDGGIVAQAQQWADPDPGRDPESSLVSSGYRVHVRRDTLLRYLAATGKSLITEVQIARRRTGQRRDGYRIPVSRIYLLDATGDLTASGLRR
jgi:hypothetical protein